MSTNMDIYTKQITKDIPEDELLSVQEAQQNGYIGFWKGKKAEVYAKSSYEAQQKLVPLFQKQAGRKKVKRTDITVKLAEKDGKQVSHSTASVGEELVSEAKDAVRPDDFFPGIYKKSGLLKKDLLRLLKTEIDDNAIFTMDMKKDGVVRSIDAVQKGNGKLKVQQIMFTDYMLG